jgi:hypothetical protein
MISKTLEKEKDEIFKSIEAIESTISNPLFHTLSEEDQDLLKKNKKELEDKYYNILLDIDNNRIEKNIDETAVTEIAEFLYDKEYMIRRSRYELKLSYARLKQKDLPDNLFGAVEYVYYLHTNNKKRKYKLSWNKILDIVSKKYDIPITTIRSEWSRRINYMRYAEKNLLI